jgi:hypothetical protein
MLSKQEEMEERKRLIGVAVPRAPGLTDEQKATLEKKIDEAKRASTYLDHVEPPAGGRHAQPQTVVGQSGHDPWPVMPEGNPWRGPDPCGQERSFGQQLTEFGVSQTSVPERKR